MLNFPSNPADGQIYHPPSGSPRYEWSETEQSWLLQSELGIVPPAGTREIIDLGAGSEIDCSLGSFFTKTVDSNTTFTFVNAPEDVAYGFTLELTYEGGIITWPSNIDWENSSNLPEFNGLNSYKLYFYTTDSGTSWRVSEHSRYIYGDRYWLAVTGNASLFLTNYRINKDQSFNLNSPSTILEIPAEISSGCAFSSDGTYLAVTSLLTNRSISIYKRNKDKFTKLSDPPEMIFGASGCSFSPDGVYLAYSHGAPRYITIYKRNGDIFTKLADPAILPTETGMGCAFSYDGIYLAVTHNGSPFVTIYKRNGDVFTKLANPTLLPPNNGRGCAFSPNGIYLAVGHQISPFITIYERSGDTFTKLSNPVGGLPSADVTGCAFSHDSTYLAVTHSGSPFVTIYKRNGDVFTKLANPTLLPPGNGQGCAFSHDSLYLAIAHSSAPFITVYKRSGDTFTKIPDPTTIPNGASTGCAFYSEPPQV